MIVQGNHNRSVETDNLENKTLASGKLSNDIWESISAFSNTDGGIIQLGVDISGVRMGIDSTVVDKVQQEVATLCSSGFNHKLYPDITVDSDNVINVYIPPVPAALRPIFSPSRGPFKGGRVRIGSTNHQLDDEWIKRFAISARGGAELIEFPGNFKELFDMKTISQYLNLVRQKRGNVYRELKTREILLKLRATQNKNVTMFGLLAFSNETALQDLTAPTANIAVTQYAGTSKVNPSDPEEVNIDDRDFSGNVIMQFEEALKFILSKLPVKGRIDPEGKRRDHFVVPVVALREILANAIVHRDYTTYSSRIQIDIYSDRIEFSNPGRSLVPLALIETAHSETRNPLLMNYLRDFKITEQRGRGIRTIKTSLKAARLGEPKFEHRADWFVATIYSTAFIKTDDQIWLQQFAAYKIKDRQLNALVYVRNNKPGITNEIYRDINNMNSVRDDIRATKELLRLTSLKLLVKVGKYRYTRYILNKDIEALPG
jgi:ATP-dependent DNA helicase RecG